MGELANGVGSQYPSHYLGTWCIQHYYRRCAHLGCQETELTPTADLNVLVLFAERRNWFLRVYHHISNSLYQLPMLVIRAGRWKYQRPYQPLYKKKKSDKVKL